MNINESRKYILNFKAWSGCWNNIITVRSLINLSEINIYWGLKKTTQKSFHVTCFLSVAHAKLPDRQLGSPWFESPRRSPVFFLISNWSNDHFICIRMAVSVIPTFWNIHARNIATIESRLKRSYEDDSPCVDYSRITTRCKHSVRSPHIKNMLSFDHKEFMPDLRLKVEVFKIQLSDQSVLLYI